ncbi:hypothetical protein KGY64_06905, partial [Candidatus Bipolaricaulota bacterium]|nr:hypothetical protein [Candidatus Bipolaricaulota bacterium]
NRHIRENLDAEGNRRSHVDFDFSVSTLDDHFSTRKASSRRRPSSRGREWEPSRKPGGKGKSKKKRAKELREPLVDLFDDEEKMRVIAIFPEVEEEEELGIELTDRVLVLKTDENREEVQLQNHPAGQPEVKFKNGIFEIVLHKNKD